MDLLNQLIDFIKQLVDIFLHLDRHLSDIVNQLGGWTYALLFLVIFAETGLVVTPFLPGDSLLFAVGAIAAIPEANLNLWGLIGLLYCAALLGDVCNYTVGKHLGPKVFSRDDSMLLNKKHLLHTQKFYKKYGGKTIILARFIPIVRTFAPFVAGVGQMAFARFATFSVVGAFLWVLPFTIAGYFFGNMPFVKQSFHYVILVILVLSVLPAGYEVWKARAESQAEKVKTNPV